MPFKSEKQRKWMHSNEPKMAKKWEKEKKDETAKRDYKDEYKKFQSSTKSKKYRAELNKYNHKKGTYGNGDGKDASHKGGKIVGFESQSKNRGRAEKSRLKKEQSITELVPNMAVINKTAYQTMLNREISKGVKIKTALNNKDHRDHNKAKSWVQRIKDKLMKKKSESVVEGEKKQYWDAYSKYYIAYEAFARETMKLAKNVSKISGDKTDEKIILKNFKKQVIPFAGLMRGWNKGHQNNPNLKESDLGLTFKKGKTVKVKHNKSGKEIVIVDKPAVRKEYEKIGFYAESVDEMRKLFQITAIKKAIAIAKKMKGNMTGAVKKIEKMNRGLSDEPDVADALKKYNESVSEEVLTESTYVNGKRAVLLKRTGAQLMRSLILNVTESPTVQDSEMQSSRVSMFKKRMDAAWTTFVKDVARANKPFAKDITGV